MRLTPAERQALKTAARKSFGEGVSVRLFGSRVDDFRRGGDIDVLVETSIADPREVVRAKSRFLAMLYSDLGDQKIDVLVDYPGADRDALIWSIARKEGVHL